jgi:hypothetical protein
MVFTMFASAATYTDVSSDSEYFNAVTLLSDLGIVTGYTDGTYGPDQTITRAEACALVARMLTGKTDVAEYQGASNFTDVAKSYWGESAIGYCVVNNIVVGDGDGKFRPDDAVTQAEFVTMVTRGLGYETASAPLTYPYGYISAAQDNGILDDVTIVPSEPALRGMDAVIVYNAIFAEYPKMATYKYVNGVYTQDIPTVAEYVYNIYELGKLLAGTGTVAKTFTITAANSIDGESRTFSYDDDTTFVIGGKEDDVENVITVAAIGKSGNTYYGVTEWMEYDCDMTKSQIDAIKRYETKIYVDKDDEDVVAIEVLDSQAKYEVSSENYEDASSNTNDGKINLDGVRLQIQEKVLNKINGASAAATTKKTISINKDGTKDEDTVTGLENILDSVKDSTVYTLYDWNGDRNIDWIATSDRVYGYVSSYTEGKKISFVLDGANGLTRLQSTDYADDGETLNASIDLTDEDENYAWSIASDVVEGSIVEIDISREYSSDVKDRFATYTVTLADVKSDVQFTAIKNSNSNDSKTGNKGDFYFDGTSYDFADYQIEGTGDENEEDSIRYNSQDLLGDRFNLYLNRNGYIVYIQAVNAEYDDYMLVLDNNGAGYNEDIGTPRVYALMDTDTFKTLTITEDAESLLFKTSEGGITSGGVYTKKEVLTDDINGALIGYSLDENGRIDDWSYVGTAGQTVKDGAAAAKFGEKAGDTNLASADIYLTVTGDAKRASSGKLLSFDDDSNKLKISQRTSTKGTGKDADDYSGSTTLLLTDKTKIFLYTNTNQTSDADDVAKVVTASELADFEGDEKYGAMYATYVTLAGSANASTVEAIAIFCGEDYFKATNGDKYPALISGITQTVVSGSSTKYSYEITAYINGDKKTLKTAEKTNSAFSDDVLKDLNDPKANLTAADFKNKLAWVTMNSEGIVTKLELVADSGLTGSISGEAYEMTRAIIVSKSSKGITFIPTYGYTMDGLKDKNGDTLSTAKDAQGNIDSSKSKNATVHTISTSDKVTNSDYATYDTEYYIYNLDVRPAWNDVTMAVKQSDLDGDYNVTFGTSSNILQSSMAGSDSDVYYMADIFFNDDGDIIAVYAYDKDFNVTGTASNNSSLVTTTLSKDGSKGGNGTSGNPYTQAVTGGYTTNTVEDVLSLLSISADDIAETKSELASGSGDIDVSTKLGDLPKAEMTEASKKANNQLENTATLYVKDTSGDQWKITVEFGYTDLQKVQYWTGKATSDLNELQEALADYDTAYDTNLSETFKDLFPEAKGAAQTLYASLNASLTVYAAGTDEEKADAKTRLENAWAAYEESISACKSLANGLASATDSTLKTAVAVASAAVTKFETVDAEVTGNGEVEGIGDIIADAIENPEDYAADEGEEPGDGEDDATATTPITVSVKDVDDSEVTFENNAGTIEDVEGDEITLVIALTDEDDEGDITAVTVDEETDPRDPDQGTDNEYTIDLSEVEDSVAVVIAYKADGAEEATEYTVTITKAEEEEEEVTVKVTIGGEEIDFTASTTNNTYNKATQDVALSMTIVTGSDEAVTSVTPDGGDPITAESNNVYKYTLASSDDSKDIKIVADGVTYTLTISKAAT